MFLAYILTEIKKQYVVFYKLLKFNFFSELPRIQSATFPLSIIYYKGRSIQICVTVSNTDLSIAIKIAETCHFNLEIGLSVFARVNG
jgi:hypothetical protein